MMPYHRNGENGRRTADGRTSCGDGGRLRTLCTPGGLFVLTAVLGQLISNTATALIVIPIGVASPKCWGCRRNLC